MPYPSHPVLSLRPLFQLLFSTKRQPQRFHNLSNLRNCHCQNKASLSSQGLGTKDYLHKISVAFPFAIPRYKTNRQELFPNLGLHLYLVALIDIKLRLVLERDRQHYKKESTRNRLENLPWTIILLLSLGRIYMASLR